MHSHSLKNIFLFIHEKKNKVVMHLPMHSHLKNKKI